MEALSWTGLGRSELRGGRLSGSIRANRFQDDVKYVTFA